MAFDFGSMNLDAINYSGSSSDYSSYDDQGHGSNLNRSDRARMQWDAMTQQQRTRVRKAMEKRGAWKGEKRAQKSAQRSGSS